MYEKVYEGMRESADGREFGVEVVKVTGELFGKPVEHFNATVIDLSDNGSFGESHFDSFATLDEAMSYVDAL